LLTATAWENREIRIYWNDNGHFERSTEVAIGKGVYSGAVADVDGDGDIDIVGEDRYAHDSRPWFYENLGIQVPKIPASYPSIFLVKHKIPAFTSIEDLKSMNREGHRARLWQDFLKQSEQDFAVPYLDPTIDFPGRHPVQLKHANVSYDMALGVTERLF